MAAKARDHLRSLRSWLRRGLPAGVRFSLVWHLASIGTGLIVALFFLFLDPFDLDEGIGSKGREVFYKVAAFAYPEERSPKTVVVTFDDQYLRENAQAWPVSYAVHAGVIDTIVQNRPDAIFIDMVFLDQRDDETLDFFIGSLKRAAKETRIYLAAAPPGLSKSPARAELEKVAAETPNIVFVSVDAGRSMGVGHAYRVTPDAAGREPAAIRIFRDLNACGRVCRAYPRTAEMDIWWGAPRLNKFNCRLPGQDRVCRHLDANIFQRVLGMLTGAFQGVLPEEMKFVDPVPVPYSPTISLTELLNGSAAATVRPRLRDAVVFYGGNLLLTGDIEETPVQGPLPGVHAHAMAYDNLVVLGGRYVVAAPPFGWNTKAHAMAAVAVLALSAFVLRTILTFRRPLAFIRPHRRSGRYRAVDTGVFVIGAIMIGVIEFTVLKVGPTTWAPILVTVLAGDVLSRRPLVGRVVLILLGRRSHGRVWRAGRSPG